MDYDIQYPKSKINIIAQKLSYTLNFIKQSFLKICLCKDIAISIEIKIFLIFLILKSVAFIVLALASFLYSIKKELRSSLAT